jgi:hypothetical protein
MLQLAGARRRSTVWGRGLLPFPTNVRLRVCGLWPAQFPNLTVALRQLNVTRPGGLLVSLDFLANSLRRLCLGYLYAQTSFGNGAARTAERLHLYRLPSAFVSIDDFPPVAPHRVSSRRRYILGGIGPLGGEVVEGRGRRWPESTGPVASNHYERTAWRVRLPFRTFLALLAGTTWFRA